GFRTEVNEVVEPGDARSVPARRRGQVGLELVDLRAEARAGLAGRRLVRQGARAAGGGVLGGQRVRPVATARPLPTAEPVGAARGGRRRPVDRVGGPRPARGGRLDRAGATLPARLRLLSGLLRRPVRARRLHEAAAPAAGERAG